MKCLELSERFEKKLDFLVLDVCLAAGLPLSPPFSSSEEVLLCCTIVAFERELCIWHNADPQYQLQSLAFNYNTMMAPIVNMSYSMIALAASHPSSSLSLYILFISRRLLKKSSFA